MNLYKTHISVQVFRRPAMDIASPTDKPRIGISACLLGQSVRFNAGHKASPCALSCSQITSNGLRYALRWPLV